MSDEAKVSKASDEAKVLKTSYEQEKAAQAEEQIDRIGREPQTLYKTGQTCHQGIGPARNEDTASYEPRRDRHEIHDREKTVVARAQLVEEVEPLDQAHHHD